MMSEDYIEHDPAALEAEERFLKLQKTVSRAANRAVVFSVLWLGGIGSAFAIYFGFQCLELLKVNAGLELKGRGKAIFGIILGICGVISFIAYWLGVLSNSGMFSN